MKSWNEILEKHKEERLKLIVQKQQIEIERLKKGYQVKGVGANKVYVTTNDVNMRL